MNANRTVNWMVITAIGFGVVTVLTGGRALSCGLGSTNPIQHSPSSACDQFVTVSCLDGVFSMVEVDCVHSITH